MHRNHMRTFYLIAITQTLSLIGSRISGLAMGIWLYRETGSATPLAMVTFFSIVPFVLLASFAGVIADRYNRRLVMAISDFGQAVGTLMLLVLFSSGAFEIWHLYLVSLLQGIAGVFQIPALGASITMLVPEDQRDRANAIRQMSNPAAGIIAPVIAGLVFSSIGVPGAIVVDLLTFLIAALVILSVHIPMPAQTAEGKALSGSIRSEMLGGLRYLWQRRGLFWLIVAFMLVNFLLNMSGVLFTPYLLARTGDDTTYGILLGLFNAGALIGALGMSVLGVIRHRVRGVVISGMLLSVFVMLIGFAQSIPALAVISLLVLMPSATANALIGSLLQMKVAPDVQGRVFAVIDQIAMLMSPIGFLLAGPLADKVFEPLVGTASWETFAPFFGTGAGSGMGLLFAICGMLSLLTIAAMRLNQSIWTLEATLPDYMPEAEAAAVAA